MSPTVKKSRNGAGGGEVEDAEALISSLTRNNQMPVVRSRNQPSVDQASLAFPLPFRHEPEAVKSSTL
jgi:hypothetical protein